MVDFEQISAPFKMQPGLSRLPTGASHLSALVPDGPLYQEKRRVVEAGQCQYSVPGFDPTDALATIISHARLEGIPNVGEPGTTLALQIAEDLAVFDAVSGTVPWMCVCVPSSWAPETKIGRSLEAIHEPVADNAAVAAAWPQLQRLMVNGSQWQRHVWTITPSCFFDQHPVRRPAGQWPSTADPSAFAACCFLRTERQTLFPVRDAHGATKREAVFTIRIQMTPLAEAVQSPQEARRLADALSTMSSAVLAYKRLTTARAPLLQWLSCLRH